MSRNPFKLKIGKPLSAEWKEGDFLDFDQSSVDPRFLQDAVEGEKIGTHSKTFFIVVLCVFSIFAGRLLQLQVFNYDHYLALAEGNRLRVQPIFAPRGLILDRFGKTLVFNQPSFELVATTSDLPPDRDLLRKEVGEVSAFFGLDDNAILASLNDAEKSSFLPVTIKQSLEKEKAVIFMTRQDSYPGFSVQNTPQRSYVNGPEFAHIVGYTGKLSAGEYDMLKAEGYIFNDFIGKEGIEAKYEKFLRGTFGERLVEVDAKGVVKKQFQQRDPESGNNVTLNIDSELQRVLYESLARQMISHRAKRAAAVALDPSTGAVLALVSLPSFDNNEFARGISNDDYLKLVSSPDHPLFNRVISGTYPPGSTVKPLIAAAALQEGVITDKTKIEDAGRLVVPNQFDPSKSYVFRGWNPAGLGLMDVYSAIAMSSDIFFYTVGGGQKKTGIEGLGPDRLSSYLKKFFLGQITGIDLPNEKSGLMPSPEWKADYFSADKAAQKWYLGDTYNMSIGQGFMNITPLQLTVATAAIANGGKIYRPQVIKSVEDAAGKTRELFEPELLSEKFIDSKYIEMARQGMRNTVTSGTARILSSLPIPVAGKTGTSQFDSGDLTNTHAWFTSFAPFENPKIVLTVLVELGGEGSSASVPVARDVYDWYSKNRMK